MAAVVVKQQYPPERLRRFYSNHPGVLDPATSGLLAPSTCRWRRPVPRTRVRFALVVCTDNRQDRQGLSSPAIRTRSFSPVNRPTAC
ncbi:MAG: hypothetical protein JXA30_18750 [Deltaproteobacteria bacterium]|nr:hypothetical protein [Deltaproteobacteria bacterium]